MYIIHVNNKLNISIEESLKFKFPIIPSLINFNILAYTNLVCNMYDRIF